MQYTLQERADASARGIECSDCRIVDPVATPIARDEFCDQGKAVRVQVSCRKCGKDITIIRANSAPVRNEVFKNRIAL